VEAFLHVAHHSSPFLFLAQKTHTDRLIAKQMEGLRLISEHNTLVWFFSFLGVVNDKVGRVQKHHQ